MQQVQGVQGSRCRCRLGQDLAPTEALVMLDVPAAFP